MPCFFCDRAPLTNLGLALTSTVSAELKKQVADWHSPSDVPLGVM
jgi:hypothetical protein